MCRFAYAVTALVLASGCARDAPSFGSAGPMDAQAPTDPAATDAAAAPPDATPPIEAATALPDDAQAPRQGDEAGCAAAVCASGRHIGALIGTDVDRIDDRPEASKTLSASGAGSDALRFNVLDRFVFANFDFNNLVSATVTLRGEPAADYELRVTGGRVTETCGTPYGGHVATTTAGTATVSTAFARFEGMPATGQPVTEDYGEVAVEVVQTGGDCNATWSLQITGNGCNSNCAWNTFVPCMDEREPRTCDEVTD